MSVAAASLQPSAPGRRLTVRGAMQTVGVAAACSLPAWVAAQMGLKGIIAIAAGLSFVVLLIVIPHREEVVLGASVLSVAAMLHKSFGGLAEVSSGPPSIYVSSFDIMIGALWFTWFLRAPDEMLTDLRVAFRRPVMWAPVAAGLLMLPSVLIAKDSTLALAEVVRMASMYLLFVYMAVRIRTRLQVVIVLAALGAVACAEALIVAGQRLTTGSLGLSVFGTPSILHDRGDGVAIARPFGTMAHPVFMAAFTGALALVAFSLAVNLRGTKVRLAWLAVSAAAASTLLISNARAASLGLLVAFLAVLVTAMVTQRLSGRIVAIGLVLLAVAMIPAGPSVASAWESSVANSHFSLEWESRMELNRLAVDMFEDAPVLGHGLNNFEYAMPRYDRYGLIFADNPVHNIYLLQLVETGVVGFLGVLTLGVPLLVLALRLTRSRDRLLSAVGFGMSAAMLFWAIEELLVFSLRQDHPRALFFLLSGLTVACTRMAGLDDAVRPRRSSRGPIQSPAHLAPIQSPAHLAPKPATSSIIDQRLRMAVHRSLASLRRSSPPTAAHVACPTGSGPETIRGRRRAVALTLAGLVVVGATSLGSAGAGGSADGAVQIGGDGPDGSLADVRIVFSAVDRTTGAAGIYTVEPGATEAHRVTPDDGRDYSWPSWAYNGAKIVFTARSGPAGGAEPVFLMDADGSDVRQVTTNDWRNAQPHVTRDGRSMVFTSFWEEHPEVAIYRMDFETGLVRNLSASSSQSGSFDSDPKLSSDGRIAFIDAREPNHGATRPGQVAVMDLLGRERQLVTNDGFHNTDPAISPDNRFVAIARYVGPGDPRDEQAEDPFQVKLEDFVLVLRDMGTGAESVLTDGEGCFRRPVGQPCLPDEGPAYLPAWTPDANSLGYVSVLSSKTTCICLINRDGTNARAAFQSDELAIRWFDWVVPGAPPDDAILDPRPAQELTEHRLLVTAQRRDGTPVLLVTTPDRWEERQLPVPSTLGAANARFAPDRSSVVFDGFAAHDPDAVEPTPPPPPGRGRSRHYTLGWMNDLLFDPPPGRELVAQRQVWTLPLDTLTLRRLTTPWMEDWRDAIPDGEERGNLEPVFSSDGRYVTFTNVSSVNAESFILRLDRQTGEVLSLTNATAGAMPVGDAQAAWAPDGRRLAFSSRALDGVNIWMMDAEGYGAVKLTDDDFINVMPTWSPDGKRVVYVSYRGDEAIAPDSDELLTAAQANEIDLDSWALVELDVASGRKRVLMQDAGTPAFKPVFSEDGSQIFFIGISGPPLQSDVWVVNADGSDPRPLQVTLQTFETSVDYR